MYMLFIKVNRLVLLIVFLLTHVSFAASSGHFAGVSFLNQGLMKNTKSPQGGLSTLGETYYPIHYGYQWAISSSFDFAPSISYTFLSRSGVDGISAKYLMIMLPLVLPAARDSLTWSFGPVISQYSVSGDGGIKTLNNGTGTANFASPQGNSNAKTLMVMGAVETRLDDIRYQAALMLETPLSSRRNYYVQLSLSYFFGGR